jgi:hypothetical protein
MNASQAAVTNVTNLSLLMVNLSQVLMSEFWQTDPNFGILDLISRYRGCIYTAEMIKIFPV